MIIGAGITGAFTAYLTALEGLSVEIIAPEAECSVASRCNPGGINPLHGPGIPGPMQNFSLESYRLHQFHAPRIQRLSGIDFKPRVISRLMLACDDIEQHTLLAQQSGDLATMMGGSPALTQFSSVRVGARVTSGLRTVAAPSF